MRAKILVPVVLFGCLYAGLASAKNPAHSAMNRTGAPRASAASATSTPSSFHSGAARRSEVATQRSGTSVTNSNTHRANRPTHDAGKHKFLPPTVEASGAMPKVSDATAPEADVDTMDASVEVTSEQASALVFTGDTRSPDLASPGLPGNAPRSRYGPFFPKSGGGGGEKRAVAGARSPADPSYTSTHLPKSGGGGGELRGGVAGLRGQSFRTADPSYTSTHLSKSGGGGGELRGGVAGLRGSPGIFAEVDVRVLDVAFATPARDERRPRRNFPDYFEALLERRHGQDGFWDAALGGVGVVAINANSEAVPVRARSHS